MAGNEGAQVRDSGRMLDAAIPFAGAGGRMAVGIIYPLRPEVRTPGASRLHGFLNPSEVHTVLSHRAFLITLPPGRAATTSGTACGRYTC